MVYELSPKKRTTDEAPPALLKPTNIRAGISGYIQIGYLPEMNEFGDVTLHIRALIALENTYMFFDIEEIANFFMKIRRHEDFSELYGGE